MSLTTPEAQADAYEWAAVLLAHGFIGLALVAVVAWATGRPVLAWFAVVAGYLLIWEVRDVSAGWDDALTDTFAVAAGALAGISAWARRGWALAVSLAAMAGVLVLGAWRR